MRSCSCKPRALPLWKAAASLKPFKPQFDLDGSSELWSGLGSSWHLQLGESHKTQQEQNSSQACPGLALPWLFSLNPVAGAFPTFSPWARPLFCWNISPQHYQAGADIQGKPSWPSPQVFPTLRARPFTGLGNQQALFASRKAFLQWGLNNQQWHRAPDESLFTLFSASSACVLSFFPRLFPSCCIPLEPD